MSLLSSFKGSPFKFVVYAPSYDENVGGTIVLHKLCDRLNYLGYESYLYPAKSNRFPKIKRAYYNIFNHARALLPPNVKQYSLKPGNVTPLWPYLKRVNKKAIIHIYTDVVIGNPLASKNIVRLFLHKPGFHHGFSEKYVNEVHVDFNDFLRDVNFENCYKYEKKLFIFDLPSHIYNGVASLPSDSRIESCYSVRKGIKQDIHNIEDATCIDGLNHNQIASIFKKSKYFYSFDLYSAYSIFAALCGCISVVIPPKGMKKEEWYKDEKNRLGIAFGLDDVDWAKRTREALLDYLQQNERELNNNVDEFATSIISYFEKKR